MQLAAKPSANTRLRPIAIGWMNPSATEPLRREEVATTDLGELLREDAAVDDLLELRPERVVDDRQQAAPQDERDRDDQQADPIARASVCRKSGPFMPPAPRPRRTRGTRPRGWPARWSGRGRRRRRSPPGTAQRRRRAGTRAGRPLDATSLTLATPSSAGAGPSTRSSTLRLRRASSVATSSSATSRPWRTIATRSQTRSTSDRTWDEKKIVRPAARKVLEDRRRTRAASAGRGPRTARRGWRARGRAGAPG